MNSTYWNDSFVIRQKGESQIRGNKKIKHAIIFKKHFLLLDTHTYGKFGVLCSLVTYLLRFVPLPYHQQIEETAHYKMKGSIKYQYNKCKQIRSFLKTCLDLLKKSLNFV